MLINADKGNPFFTRNFNPYLTNTRTASRWRRGASSAGDTKDARDWLRSNGHQVSDRGRIPAPLLELYRNR